MKRTIILSFIISISNFALAQETRFPIGVAAYSPPQNPNWVQEKQNLELLGVNEIQMLHKPNPPLSSETLTVRKICDATNGSIKGMLEVSPTIKPGGWWIWQAVMGWKNGLPVAWQDTVKAYLLDIKNTYAERPVIGSMMIAQEWWGYNSVNVGNCDSTQWSNMLTAMNYTCMFWRDSLDLPAGIRDKSSWVMPVDAFGVQLPYISLKWFLDHLEELGFYEDNYFPFYPDVPSIYELNSSEFLAFQNCLNEIVRRNDSCYNYFENPAIPKGNRNTKWGAWIQSCEMRAYPGGPIQRRWPTKEEMRCQAWLALSRGAKGIKYFTYFTYFDGSLYFRGLVDENRYARSKYTLDPPYPDYSGPEYDLYPEYRIFDWIKELNFDLQTIGPILANLTCHYAFSVNHEPGYEPTLPDMDGYNLVINGVAAQDSVYHVRDFLEVGVFDNASDEHFLMLVNRYCQPQDMVEVKVKLNYTPTYRFESYFVIDALNNQAVTGLLPSTMDTSFTVSLLPGGGRLLKLVPITSIISINNDTRHTNYRFSHLYTSANTPYSEDSVRVVQSFFSSGKGNWDHTDTGWLPYTEESIQRLWPSDNNYPNVFEVYYKIDGGKIATPATHWQRNYNQQPPESGSLTLNGGAGYANSRNITVKVSGSDAVPGVEKKRYDESPFGLSSGYRNLIKNGVFNNDSSWTFFNATVQDGFVTLWGRDSLDTTQLSASIKQTVPESTVNACRGKLMRVTNYIYSQEVLKAQRYVDVFFQDTLTPSSIRYVFKNIASSAGGYWWNQTDTFSLDLGSRLVDRMEVWYRLYGGIEAKPGDPDSFRYTMDIDNVRLEPVYYDTVTQTVKDWWVNFGDSSAVYNYTVSAGDGSKRLYLQLEDSAENISPEPGWHSDIILDMTKPTADITSPLNNAYINGTVNIYGYAGDANFQGWTLEYKKYFLGTWTTLHNDTTQRVPPGSPMLLCQWNTTTVTDGKYYLRLTATDKATNAKADSHQVNVRNNGNPKGAIKPDFATFECLPVDAATDQLGNLYITDTQDNKVWKYSPDGDSLMCFGYRATGQDTTGFSQPVGIAVDDSCYIWVADCYNAKVKKFSQDGTMLLSFGEHGNGPGQFNQPTGLLVDSGVIYVTDKMNDRVQKFSSDGSFISQFGQDALWQPSGLAIKRESDDTVTNSYLYVSDTKHDRIVKFSLDGVLLDSLAYGIGLDQAWDISFDNFNNLFIADVQNNRIIELDPWDSPLWCFGGWGSDTGQFRLPQGLAVSPDGQYLYVVDTHNNRIQRVTVRSVDGGGGAQSVSRILMPSQIPNAFNLGQGYPNPSRQNASISFALPKAGDISLRIYNISGQLVKTLAQGNFNPGFYTVKWDGRDGKGIQAANGVYLYRLRAGGYERTIKAILLR